MSNYRDRPIFTRHGGPYDRGAMDSYYRRGFNPHYYAGDSMSSPRLEKVDMSTEEIAAYAEGYEDNERDNNFKQW